MSYTYKLRGSRFLRCYTAKHLSPSYAASVDAQLVVDQLCDVPWVMAKSDGPATFPSHQTNALDSNIEEREIFDAALFCAEHKDGMHRAYANAAFYVFKLPVSNENTIEKVEVDLFSDPYNEFGARVSLHLLNDLTLPSDCVSVREGDVYVKGAVPRKTETQGEATYWQANSGTVTLTPPVGSTLPAYLAVFVGLEDYGRSRGDWLEGSSFIGGAIRISVTTEIAEFNQSSINDCSVPSAEVSAPAEGRLVTQYGDFFVADGSGDTINVADNIVKISYGTKVGRHAVRSRILAPDGIPEEGWSLYRNSYEKRTNEFMEGKFICLWGNSCYGSKIAPFLALYKGVYDANLASLSETISLDSFLQDNKDFASWFDSDVYDAMLNKTGITDIYVGMFLHPESHLNTGLELYVSTKSSTWLVFKTDDYNDFSSLVPPKRIGGGADLLISTSDGRIRGHFDGEGNTYRIVHPVRISGNDVVIEGKGTVSVEGTVTGIAQYVWAGSGKFVVSGNFKAVGGVPCNHVAVVDINSNNIRVNVPSIDSLDLTPNTYSNFRIKGIGGENECFVAMGDFVKLGGLEAPYGAVLLHGVNKTSWGGERLFSMPVPLDDASFEFESDFQDEEGTVVYTVGIRGLARNRIMV